MSQRDKGNMKQRQKIEDEGNQEGNKGKGAGFLSRRRLPLDRGKTDVAHRKIAVYKGNQGDHQEGVIYTHVTSK